MDWFERITGFKEAGWAATRARLRVEDGCLVSDASPARHAIGRFETPSLGALRAGVAAEAPAGRTRVRCLVGDARVLHADPRFDGATFQVASQFNALEMVAPGVTPEHGVTRYADDATQGPACAMAAGAATIWRNYLVPLPGGDGQTATRQLDTLAGVGAALQALLARPVSSLWTMRNGYCLATAAGLRAIGGWLAGADDEALERLRGTLAVAWHHDAAVTDVSPGRRQRVSQVFCSALPVAYSQVPPALWAPFARLVLEAAYEATLLVAARRRAAGESAIVLLTRLGGGAFGNDDAWIDDAIVRALARAGNAGLDVVLVSHGSLHPSLGAIAERWARGG